MQFSVSYNFFCFLPLLVLSVCVTVSPSLYSHRISSIFSLLFYIFMCVSLMFLLICITLKSVPALKVILSFCLAEEGQTDSKRRWELCQAEAAAALLQVRDQEKAANKRKEERRVGLLPLRIICSNQLHLANWACFGDRMLFLANSMIVAGSL